MRLIGWSIAVVGVVLLTLLGWGLLSVTSTGLPPSIVAGLTTGQTLLVLAAIIGLGLALIGLAERRRKWYRAD